MMKNSLNLLNEWYFKNEKEKDSKRVVDEYIKLICVGSPDDLSSELRKACKEGIPLEDCPSYPIILKTFKDLGIEIDFFPTMIMHLYFLGLMKSPTAQSNRLRIHPSTTVTRDFWGALRNWIIPRQKELQKLSISWCNPNSFNTSESDKKKNICYLLVGCQVTVRRLQEYYCFNSLL